LIAVGQPDVRQVGIDFHGAAAVADVGDHFHADPGAGEAREGDGQQAVVDDLLRIAGIQERDAYVEQAELALVRNGGAFRDRIIAAQHDRGAVLAGPAEIGMAENVAGTVHAGSFAVPDSEHAVHFALADHVVNLAAHDGGGGQVFVHAGPEMDVVFREQFSGPGQRHIITA
jgi:hypothetical protein